MVEIPTLETERLELRAISPADRFAILANYSDPDVACWFLDEPFTRLEQAEQIIRTLLQKAEHGQGCTWAIVLKETREVIGTCGYESCAAGARGEIGFDLAKAHWGKGLMTEALRLIVAYGWNVLKVPAVCASTYAHNSRARRVLEKLGLTVESTNSDSVLYVLERSQWPERKVGVNA